MSSNIESLAEVLNKEYSTRDKFNAFTALNGMNKIPESYVFLHAN